MPCNPSIGGTAKGHLVREIDALGGEMGIAADKNTLQSRMLNRGKGPAVHSLRAQIDRREYTKYMKHCLENQENLDLKQAEIVSLNKTDDGLWEMSTQLEAVYKAKTVIIATGTFLKGKVYVGDVSYESGPDGMFPSNALSDDFGYSDIDGFKAASRFPAYMLSSGGLFNFSDGNGVGTNFIFSNFLSFGK